MGINGHYSMNMHSQRWEIHGNSILKKTKLAHFVAGNRCGNRGKNHDEINEPWQEKPTDDITDEVGDTPEPCTCGTVGFWT